MEGSTKRFYFDMVGCRLNQAEIESMAAQLQERGFEISNRPENADYILVNTCCVTEKAGADSRKMLRRYQANSNAQVISTGCWSSLFTAEAAQILPGIELVPNEEKDQFAANFLKENRQNAADLPVKPRPNMGSRGRTRAFVKVQDGCDNYCSYCATRLARGRSRSVPAEQIVAQLKRLEGMDVKEVVFCGVQLGAWGKEAGSMLADLLAQVLERTEIPRLRLSSIEPWDINPALIALFRDPRLMPHLHIPLQSASKTVLRAMQRPGGPEAYARLWTMLRASETEIALSTDIIVGFPGESDADFEETFDFVKTAGFSRGHVFQFSPVRGTLAANLENQVPANSKKERSACMRELFDSLQQAYLRKQVGKTMDVLFESRQSGANSGLSPDFQRVKAQSNTDLENQILPVLIKKVSGDGLEGLLA